MGFEQLEYLEFFSDLMSEGFDSYQKIEISTVPVFPFIFSSFFVVTKEY
jgi:hypothetical protein